MHGQPDAAAVLKQMDELGVARILVMSETERVSLQRTRENLLDAKKLLDAAPDRISGLGWVNPTIPGIAGLAEEALCEMGFVGLKIIPDHWYAYEERLEPFWEKMHALEARILFHTGILYGYDDGSRFCRPLWLEKLLHYPNIRFAMAHMSWPWTDECFAVCGKFRAAGGYKVENWRAYADITSGAPRIWKVDAMRKGLAYMGDTQFVYGSDCFRAEDPEALRRNLDEDRDILRECGCSKETMERVFTNNALRWLGLG
jgi:predicted TIM-barrel fold metal-dependent hydrolase